MCSGIQLTEAGSRAMAMETRLEVDMYGKGYTLSAMRGTHSEDLMDSTDRDGCVNLIVIIIIQYLCIPNLCISS